MKKSKRIRSSQFQFQWQWQLILGMLAILSCNTNTSWNIFTFARPIQSNSSSKSCTVTATIDKLEGIATFGVQEFGKQINSLPDTLVAQLTILPGDTFDELCKVNAEDYTLAFLKSLRFPPGKIAAMVDLDTGGCDHLTKASNALVLQKYLTPDLQYILFYKSKDRYINFNEIPTLDLDRTMPPTNWPTMLPTNTPSQIPTDAPTVSMQPSTKPSVSVSPSFSADPSSLPSVVPTTAEPTTHQPTTHPPTWATEAPTRYTTEAPTRYSTDAPTTYTTDAADSPTEPTTTPIASVQPSTTKESVRFEKTSHLHNKNPWTYEITNIFDSTREDQKKELEENDTMVFMTLSKGDAHSILEAIYRAENWELGGGLPLFSVPGNEKWDMKLYFSTEELSPPCGESYPTPTSNDNGRIPTPAFVTSKPTPPPILLGTDSQPYQDNAPGTFQIFKFIFFALLIASPCLRLAHQWWAGGGRIRLRRSEQNYNRVVGLQYIPPMDNWFGSPLGGGHAVEVPSPPDRMTYQQIMSLPEIQYTKPIHTEDKLALSQVVHTIEEEDGGDDDDDDATAVAEKITESNNDIAQTKTSETESELSEASFENEPSVRLELTTTTTAASPRPAVSSHKRLPTSPLPVSSTTASKTEPSNHPVSLEPENDRDDSIVSEASFENEPSVRLELPTSPMRVSSRSVTPTLNNPISPRAIVVTDQVPLDEETPEEQQQQQQRQRQRQQANLQQPMLSHSPLPAQTQAQTQQQQESQSHHSPQQPQNGALSFRTQRRLQNFTTTTCTCCSICIDEFEEGETIRLLPRCGHAFHTSCILPWLQDRQGCCPLCKMEVLDRTSIMLDSEENSRRDRTMDSERAIVGEDVSRRAEF